MMPDSDKPSTSSSSSKDQKPKPESPRRSPRPRSRPETKSTALTTASNQLSLRGKALAQFRQALRSSPRTALAYELSKDLFLVLRYLPSGIYNRIQNSFNSQLNLTPNSRNQLPSQPPAIQQDSRTQRFSDAEEINKIENKPRATTSTDQSVLGGSSSPVSSSMNQPALGGSSSTGSSTPQNQSVLTDLYGKAAYLTIFVREKMLNRSSSSSATTKSQPALPSGEENEKPEEKKEPEKDGKRKAETKNVPDWTTDPELKPFLHDMNVEWRNIEARTKYLVSKVNAASEADDNVRAKMQYLEDLFNHLSQYREARITAVEAGALKSLRNMLKKYGDEACVVNCVRETLAVLGANPPVKGHGLRVLSIDGGGVRGLVAIEVLRMIEKQTGQKIHELFDYICGVSTGSVLAFLIGAHRRTLSECEALYKQLSQEIFNQSTFFGAGNLLWSHSYYDTATWERLLKRHIGECPLITLARDPDLPRVAAISTLVNQERVTPYVFRTYAFRPGVRSRYAGGFRYQMWEAVRASAAAPTYFEEVKLGQNLHQDGGVLVNNPTSVALSEAKTIWPGQPLQCVMSLGTGQTFSSRKDPNMSDLSNPPNSKSPNSLSWKGKFLKVLDSATDTESVHHTLMELLPPHQYFRFNPHISEMVTMDEARPEKLDKLQAETREYLLRNMDKVEYCCEQLTRPKGVTKKVYDWWTSNL